MALVYRLKRPKQFEESKTMITDKHAKNPLTAICIRGINRMYSDGTETAHPPASDQPRVGNGESSA
jgi:hypothetical protein